MKNFNRHNDLISNFFYLINKIYSYDYYTEVIEKIPDNIKEQALTLSFEVDDNLTDKNILLHFILDNAPKEIIELIKIRDILETRMQLGFDSKDLLISRYFFFTNWKILIKEYLKKEIIKNDNLRRLKNQIISTLKEINYRSGIEYTMNIYDVAELMFIKQDSLNCIFPDMSTSITEIDDDLEFENDVLSNDDLETKEPLSIEDLYVFYVKDLKNDVLSNDDLETKEAPLIEDEETGLSELEKLLNIIISFSNPFNPYRFSYNNCSTINDDIEWINTLTIEDLKNQKIILSPKLKKVTLISLITEIQKGKKNYNEGIGKEIQCFIDFITDKNSIISNYNLSFLKSKKQNREFAKIFLLLYYKELIINKTKGELIKILADCLNISDTTLEKYYSDEKMKKEFEKKSPSSEVYLVKKRFLRKNK